jgi:hypothetical protein
MMIDYDIYDCFTMEHIRLRQRITLTTKLYCSRLYNFIDGNISFELEGNKSCVELITSWVKQT